MKRLASLLLLSIAAMVLTTNLGTAHAEEKDGTSSCELSYIDVFCAKNPEECKKSQALLNTSVHADFLFSPPQYASVPSVISPVSTQLASNFGGSFDSEKLFNLVNSYRASVGLLAFAKSPELCAIADSRGPELAGEIANGDIHGGMRRRNLPHIVENMKWGTSEEEILSWWLNSPVHSSAINGSHTYACTHCTGEICIMLFTNGAVSPTPSPSTLPLPVASVAGTLTSL